MPARHLSGATEPSGSGATESSGSATLESESGATEPSGSAAMERGFQTFLPYEWRTKEARDKHEREFPNEWRAAREVVRGANWKLERRIGDGKSDALQTGFQDGARTKRKARLQDVEDSQLPRENQEAWGVPLTEAAVNNMNEAIAKQDELRRAKRKNIAKQDE